MSRAEELKRYVELSEWIRELSSPQVEGTRTPEEYRKQFVRNYARIYELSRTCREILSSVLFPLLEKDGPLTDEEAEDLFRFSSDLLDAVNIECVDVPLRSCVIDRLLKDAEEKNDTALILRALDARVEICYFMMGAVSIVTEAKNLAKAYREKGMEAEERILSYLDKDKFVSLPDYASKEIVLVNSRYINAFYEYIGVPEEEAHHRALLSAMKRALELADDPFFIDQASKYNWKNHIFRTLQGIANMTEYMNKRGVPEDMMAEVSRYTRQMVAFWKRDKISYGALCAPETLYLCMYRNAYFAGEITCERFRKELAGLIEGGDRGDFSHDGTVNNLLARTEYMMTLKKEELTNDQKEMITRFYQSIVAYVHRMPKLGSLSYLLVFLKYALDIFVEFEGGPVYADLLLDLLASVLPQNYMHSLGVADLSRILAGSLFRLDAKRFEQIPGYPNLNEIEEFFYRAGLLHDVGKLMVAERILTYNRDWFEEENVIYATGPEIGAKMLARMESTRPYAEAVRTHHYAFDRTDTFAKLYGDGTYPEGAAVAPHILRLANDLQWMTTEIRYSSVPRLDYDGFLERAQRESGTTYAPYVVALLDDAQTAVLLKEALDKEMTEIYRKTFELLKSKTD